MLPFDKKILKLLNDYKLILRKHVARQEWAKKIHALGLKRKQLRMDDEIKLYHKAHKVVEDIMSWTDNANNTASWYSGIDEFCQHLKNVLAEYQIDNDKILHTSQYASRAMVEAIQIMKMPHARLTLALAEKLDACGQIIAHHGTREQQEIFTKSLKNYQHADINFFMPLVQNFEKYLHDFAALFVNKSIDTETH